MVPCASFMKSVNAYVLNDLFSTFTNKALNFNFLSSLTPNHARKNQAYLKQLKAIPQKLYLPYKKQIYEVVYLR